MSEIQQILALSRRALAHGEQLCLATVVHVEGSSYRKPGARMLLTSGGERAGTISGGCLEAEISRKAWWLTANGPRVEQYSSFAEEDGSLPYGLGCGGTVTLLLEQGPAVLATLRALERGLIDRQPSVVIAGLHHAEASGTLAVVTPFAEGIDDPPCLAPALLRPFMSDRVPAGVTVDRLVSIAAEALAERRSSYRAATLQRLSPEQQTHAGTPTSSTSALPAYFVEYLAPPPALTIFGAGDDAQPIAALAYSLGWRVTVADGRAHLAHRDRFPQAAAIRVLDWEQALGHPDPGLRAACGLNATPGPARAIDTSGPAGNGYQKSRGMRRLETDPLAIILTHSYEQDRALLGALLPRSLEYLGILGPRHRTERLLGEVAPALGLSVDQAFARLHSPVGLDLGATDPASVALSILAEIQAVLHHRRVTITRDAEIERALSGSGAASSAEPAEVCRG